MAKIDQSKTRKVVGQKLKHARKAMKKTIHSAATEAGIHPATLSKIEKGKVNFRFLTLVKICKVYDLDPKTLLDAMTLEC